MKYEYAVTAKKTRNPITTQHYCNYLDKLKSDYKIGNVYFETTKGLHVHFLLKSDYVVPYHNLTPTKRGWNVKAVPIHDRKGWHSYCRKDHDKKGNKHKDLHDIYDSEEYIDEGIKCNIFKKHRDTQQEILKE